MKSDQEICYDFLPHLITLASLSEDALKWDLMELLIYGGGSPSSQFFSFAWIMKVSEVV
jgi:hypothetical protein